MQKINKIHSTSTI